MDAQLINLHFAQLVRAWHKSRYNKYSDTAKQEYHDKLELLFKHLKNIDFDKYEDSLLEEYKNIIEFFLTSLEFLDNSTLNLIPFEIVECLKVALGEWIDNPENLIIVTSLEKGNYSYSFDPSLILNTPIYTIIKNRTDIDFDKKLIQINLPNYLARDYLSNVVLYHELGHVFDGQYLISSRIMEIIWDKFEKGNLTVEQKVELSEYFPYLSDTSYEANYRKLVLGFHCREYFSDLFASQYIEMTSCHFLDYITMGTNNFSETHPGTLARTQLVHNFVNGKKSFLVDLFASAVKVICKRDLKIRFCFLPLEEFLSLLPIIITSKENLHSLFVLGWDIWLNHSRDIIQKNNMVDVKAGDLYQIINNLIEKSISNFLVCDKWKTAKICI